MKKLIAVIIAVISLVVAGTVSAGNAKASGTITNSDLHKFENAIKAQTNAAWRRQGLVQRITRVKCIEIAPNRGECIGWSVRPRATYDWALTCDARYCIWRPQ
jgi:hypothetical protein